MKQEIKLLRKIQDKMIDMQYPGYPYQDSIIIDLETEMEYGHYSKGKKGKSTYNEFCRKLLYFILGHEKSTKGTWLNNRHIAPIQEFLDYNFDYESLYIDDYDCARLYFALHSALCECYDNKEKPIIWACIDEDSEWIDCKIFRTLDEIKQYKDDYFWEED